MNSTSDFQTVNSLTYADVAGLQIGLPRLPGETTAVYVDRLYRATIAKRDHSYEGLLDELVLELGLTSQVAGTITGPLGMTVAIAPGLLVLANTRIPLATLDGDGYLRWKTLGDVFAAINAVPEYTATLTADPATLALQLARQGNVRAVVNEPVLGTPHAFPHTGVYGGSVRFNQPVPGWALDQDRLVFTEAVDPGLLVSYQYAANPFDVVVSDVGLFALADPALAQAAVGVNNVLAYQIRECIQTVMRTDRSYWTR